MFQTSSMSLTWLLYELAQNQSIQETLYTEIEKVEADGDMSSDTLDSLTYVDACLKEILRYAAEEYYQEFDFSQHRYRWHLRTSSNKQHT